MAQQDVFEAGHTYVIMANNGRYISRIDRSGINYIEAEKISIDLFSRFRASVLGDGRIALKADDGEGNYLSRIDRGRDNIEAAKIHIDIFSEFEVERGAIGPDKWNGTRYIYFKADNGKFWGF